MKWVVSPTSQAALQAPGLEEIGGSTEAASERLHILAVLPTEHREEYVSKILAEMERG